MFARPSFTGNLILAGKGFEFTAHDLEPAGGFLAAKLIACNARQKRSVESDDRLPDHLTRDTLTVDRQLRHQTGSTPTILFAEALSSRRVFRSAN
jgi:hypothetical protein